jgi:hypothetical protein
MRCLILPLALVLCLLPGVFSLGNCAQANSSMPGGDLIAQADGTEKERSQKETDPSLPLAHEKRGSRSIIRMYAGFNFRTDQLDWNIADADGDPNILSELTWDDLSIYELSLGFSSFVKQSIYFRGYMNYGRIMSGENQDSDYNADDRQDEFSRSNNSTDDGSTIDVSLGAGYMFPAIADIITIVPMVGLSFHRQDLTITDGYQTIPPSGPFPGLSSTYVAEWRGPWAGLEAQVDIETGWGAFPRIFTFVGMEYHWATFDAQADWNLREDFDHPKSFEHEAQGSGVRMVVGLGASLTDRWSLAVDYSQQKWSVADGTDRVYYSDGTFAETRLNEVNWESRAIGLTMQYQF